MAIYIDAPFLIIPLGLLGFLALVFGFIRTRSGDDIVCPSCNYDLRPMRPGGATIDELRKRDLHYTCPECGHHDKWGRVARGPMRVNRIALGIGIAMIFIAFVLAFAG